MVQTYLSGMLVRLDFEQNDCHFATVKRISFRRQFRLRADDFMQHPALSPPRTAWCLWVELWIVTEFYKECLIIK